MPEAFRIHPSLNVQHKTTGQVKHAYLQRLEASSGQLPNSFQDVPTIHYDRLIDGPDLVSNSVLGCDRSTRTTYGL